MIQYKYEREKCQSAAYDEGEKIGFCSYEQEGDTWKIMTTYVNPEYGGQGIAKKLVLMIAEEAKKQNITLIPICSYAVKVLG
ncbi:MAG: GNAT family N-acetyltransferase [Allobaculum sp.]